MSFVRNAAGVLSTSVAKVVIGVGTHVVLARWLSVDDRGLYSVATNVAGILGLFLNLGWPSASIYRLRRVGSPPEQVASAALVMSVVIPVITVFLFLWLAPEISKRFLGDAPVYVVWLAFAVVPFDVISNTFTSIARGMDRWLMQNMYRLSIMLSVLLGTSVVLILLDGELTAALAVFVACHLVVSVVFVARLLSVTGVTLRLNFEEIRDGLRFGLKSYVQSLAGKMHERADILLLAWLLDDPAQIALYAIAVSFVQRLNLIPEGLSNALLPQLASQTNEDAASFTAKVTRHSFGWVVLMAVVLAVAAPVMIPLLFGAQYRASIPAFLILLPGMVFYMVYRVVARFFVATDRQQANIASELTSLATNVGLNLWLIPKYGILGAALASLVSYTLSATFILTAFRIATGIGVRRMLVVDRADLELYRKRLATLRADRPWRAWFRQRQA